MRYIVSDVHGEYELFVRLLEHISFSEEDEMYICGDVIVSIQNQEGLKISSITAYLKGKGDQLEKKLPAYLESTTEFDLPTDTYGGNIEASIVVVVVYKIGIFKTKQIKTTVSKNF